MNINIISLEENDFQKYRDLRLEALQDSPTAFGGTYEFESQLSDEEWKKRLTREHQMKLFAEFQENIIGMTVCSLQPNSRTAHVAHIYSVYVQPEFRGKGIARKLMNAILNKVRKDTMLRKLNVYVNAENVSAIAFYTSVGFEQAGILRQEMYYDGVYYDEILMELFLQ